MIPVDPVTSGKTPASLAGNSVNQKLPAMTADMRAATLRANKCVICVFYISQIVILTSNDLSERFLKKKKKKILPN